MQTAAGGIARVAEVWRRKFLNCFWLTDRSKINATENTGPDYACLFHLSILTSRLTMFRLFPSPHFLFAEFFFARSACSVKLQCFYAQLDSKAERSVFSIVSSSGRCLSLSHLETSWPPEFTNGFSYRFSRLKDHLQAVPCTVTMACPLHLPLNMHVD